MSNQVQVDLRVGLLDVSLAQLITKDHQLIEFPTLLLPSDVKAGSIVRLTCERDVLGEEKDSESFESTQNAMLEAFTVSKPKTPVLRVKNTTQTSTVLEWDPIDVASANLHSLALYKNGQRLGNIPGPEKRTSTKLSNLAIDNAYTFHLVMATSAGTYESEKVKVQTHKMTDLSGITICVGDIEGSAINLEDLEESVAKMGCKPLQDSVKLDTTHFVATSEAGAQYQRAKDLSIPIVRPEWLKACETERRLVGVRAYYLSADPRTLPPTVRRSRTATVTSARKSTEKPSLEASSDQSAQSASGTSKVEAKELKDPEEVTEKAKLPEETGNDLRTDQTSTSEVSQVSGAIVESENAGENSLETKDADANKPQIDEAGKSLNENGQSEKLGADSHEQAADKTGEFDAEADAAEAKETDLAGYAQIETQPEEREQQGMFKEDETASEAGYDGEVVSETAQSQNLSDSRVDLAKPELEESEDAEASVAAKLELGESLGAEQTIEPAKSSESNQQAHENEIDLDQSTPQPDPKSSEAEKNGEADDTPIPEIRVENPAEVEAAVEAEQKHETPESELAKVETNGHSEGPEVSSPATPAGKKNKNSKKKNKRK